MEFLLFFIAQGVYAVTAAAAYSACPAGNCISSFIEVRTLEDHLSTPTCPLLKLTHGIFGARELCYAMACELGGNVVRHNIPWYNDVRNNYTCEIYTCNSNIAGTDWDYEWLDNDGDNGRQVYARPHPSIPKCHSSYFRRRWLRKDRWKGGPPCHSISNHTVGDVFECMSDACRDKANTFRIYPDESRCETMHCGYDNTDFVEDYILNFNNSDDDAIVYTLSHLPIGCNSHFKHERMTLPSPITQCNEAPLCGHGSNQETFCNMAAGTNVIISNFRHGKLNWTNPLRCFSNPEGTGWQYFIPQSTFCWSLREDNVNKNNMWLVLPYPGTPVCNSSLYVIKKPRHQCLMSGCNGSGIKVPQARDLRQCMLYACEYGANVINYFLGGTDASLCDLRFCNVHQNGDYDLQLGYSGPPGPEIYVLAIQPETPTPTTLPVSTYPSTTENDTAISTLRTTSIILWVVLFIVIIVIIVIIAVIVRSIQRIKRRKGVHPIDPNPNGQNPNPAGQKYCANVDSM